MSEELKPGMTHEMERQVTEDLSAQKVFPHVPNVYATRAMVGHFEEVCAEMVLPHLRHEILAHGCHTQRDERALRGQAS
jgi:predicted thioesterase